MGAQKREMVVKRELPEGEVDEGFKHKHCKHGMRIDEDIAGFKVYMQLFFETVQKSDVVRIVLQREYIAL